MEVIEIQQRGLEWMGGATVISYLLTPEAQDKKISWRYLDLFVSGFFFCCCCFVFLVFVF